ncbi:MAG: zinc ribbon domain-containing protein [Anaerolineaceae bacterium]|nr:zinc ribbon domain-containing protein [Anaerolineaceae bacterium]MBN2678450.1 zinc ribbon domain-containing protein [Anaerolineaceae bacterium]
MPTYTYQCDNCGIRFDYYQKYEDQALRYCPECNKKSLRKVYAPVGIVFKGSGFYATDHRSPSGAPSTTAEKNTKVDSPVTTPEKMTSDTTKSKSAEATSAKHKD